MQEAYNCFKKILHINIYNFSVPFAPHYYSFSYIFFNIVYYKFQKSETKIKFSKDSDDSIT